MKKIFLILAMLPMLFSCEGEEAMTPDNSQPSMRLLRFGMPTIGVAVESRANANLGIIGGSTFSAAGSPWEFGMFIYEYTDAHECSSDAHKPAAIGHDDIKAVAKIPGTNGNDADWTFYFNPIGEGGSVRDFTDLGVPDDKNGIVMTYYPHSTEIKAPHSIKFETATQPEGKSYYKPEQIDYLWADPKPYTQTDLNGKIYLEFNHVMTCIEIVFSNMYAGEVTLKNLTLTDTQAQDDGTGSCIASSGYFDAYNGEIEVEERVQSLTYAESTIGSESSLYFIIPPIAASDVKEDRLQLSFSLNNEAKVYKYNLPIQNGGVDLTSQEKEDGQETEKGGYKRGCRYQYKVIIDNTMKFQPGEISTNDPSHWKEHDKEIDIEI